MEEPPEITALQLKRLIDSGARINLIDVREANEYAFCHINGSRLVPVREIPMQSKEFDREEEYVFYCHIGERSAWAVNYLRHLGFRKVRTLKGGIDQWAAEIDPSTPRY
jgi:sulfur-carrier protein adenylyltransferase/sulfurtransferase